MNKAEKFLEAHKLRAGDLNPDNLIDLFNEEMEKGLAGDETGSLKMIPTYIEADNEFLKDTPVVAIDAGGTNFRCSLVSFTSEGKIKMDEIKNYGMPGLDREVSKKEFFDIMAGYISHVASKSERFGFCFSYPTEIFPDKDGKLIQFTKELKAPEVAGQVIGKSLLEALGTPEKKIVLLNDTVATLLAGKSASFEKSYDSYIGFILGTGTNMCYIESNKNITKNKQLNPAGSMIINMESGNFSRTPRTDLDIAFDNTTLNPGVHAFEKMISGGYIGGLALHVLKAAAKEGVFSEAAKNILLNISELTTEQAGNFVEENNLENNVLSKCFTTREDVLSAVSIIDNLINRAALLAAASIAAVVLKTGKGKDSGKPVLVTIEGTTYYKLFRLKERFEKHLAEILDGPRKRYVDFSNVSQSSLIGAALAGLID